ncbi:MAG: hypothetical protein EBZ51_10940 [Synechococcaceae bacterium WB9_2_112]|nr:hypothetical protein [Synechococcaceae bacterium WB9_2_112]
MRFSWAQHQHVARLVQSVMASPATHAAGGQPQQAEALALMGVSLLMLMQDLVLLETSVAVWPD